MSEKIIAEISCTLIGAGALAYGFYQRSKLSVSRSWPQVMGTMTSAEVVKDTGPDSGGYIPAVEYNYEVNEVLYTGKRVVFDSPRTYVRQSRAQAVVDRYPVNSSVIVYFDPGKPSDAVLSREYPDNIMLIAFGIGFLVFVPVMVIWG